MRAVLFSHWSIKQTQEEFFSFMDLQNSSMDQKSSPAPPYSGEVEMDEFAPWILPKHHCSDRPQVSEEASSCDQLTPPVVKKFDWLILIVTDRMYGKVYLSPSNLLPWDFQPSWARMQACVKKVIYYFYSVKKNQ